MAEQETRLPPGFIQDTVNRLARIQNANQIEGLPAGGVTVTYSAVSPGGQGTITVAATLPFSVDLTPTGQVIKVIDFAQ